VIQLAIGKIEVGMFMKNYSITGNVLFCNNASKTTGVMIAIANYIYI
jgi:hypothetical protein